MLRKKEIHDDWKVMIDDTLIKNLDAPRKVGENFGTLNEWKKHPVFFDAYFLRQENRVKKFTSPCFDDP